MMLKKKAENGKNGPEFYREREDEEKTVASSAASEKLMATEFRTVPQVNDYNTPEGEEAELTEIEQKAEVVKTAATKHNLCPTEYSVESQIEDYLDREEQHKTKVESLKEENIATRRNLVSITRMLSSRRRIDALANDELQRRL